MLLFVGMSWCCVRRHVYPFTVSYVVVKLQEANAKNLSRWRKYTTKDICLLFLVSLMVLLEHYSSVDGKTLGQIQQNSSQTQISHWQSLHKKKDDEKY